MTNYNPFPILLKHQFKDQKLGNLWITRYIKFIKAIQAKRLTDLINEKWNIHIHHIVPKCWGGPDIPENKVSMTIREHIVAHHLLCKTLDPLMGFAMVKLMGFGNKIQVDPNKLFNYAVGLRIAADANKARALQLLSPVCNLNTGKIYDGVLEASLTECGNEWAVATALYNGSKANGCYWMRCEDMDHDPHWHLQKILDQKQQRTFKLRLKGARAVINLMTKQQYPSISIAAEEIGCTPDALTSTIRHREVRNGCMWEFVDCVEDIDEELQKRFKIREFNKKYKRCLQLVDLYTKKVYNRVDDISKEFGTSCSTLQKYINAFIPYKDLHYFVRQAMIDDFGYDNVVKMLNEWNRLYIQTKENYKKTKLVINLSTGEKFDSVTKALQKYPNDNIQHCVYSHNPSSYSQHYWMFERDVTKSVDQHLKEFQIHFNNVTKRKRRLNSAQLPTPVVDLTHNVEYESITAYVKSKNDFNTSTTGNISKCFKKQLYYINGVVLVPKALLQTINDVEAFKTQQLEKYRISNHNLAVINMTTLKRYPTIDKAACAINANVSTMRWKMLKKIPFEGNVWVYEKNIPYDQYKNLKLTYVV